jgi:hypothetical protein
MTMALTIAGFFLGEQTSVTVQDDAMLQADPGALAALHLAAGYYDGRAIGESTTPLLGGSCGNNRVHI